MTMRPQPNDVGLNPRAALDIARRRFRWFAIPAAAGFALTLVLSFLWPAEYEASATIQIVPQGVPESLVESMVQYDIEAQFSALQTRIKTRDNLVNIIQDFKLYGYDPQAPAGPIEELVERMKSDIEIEVLPPPVVDPRRPVEIRDFRITYRGRDPQIVARVANRLANDFQNQNIEIRQDAADGTSAFIEAELKKAEDARSRLAQELYEFNDENQGTLPGNLPANTARLERLLEEARGIRSALEVAENQAYSIKQQIHQLRVAGTDKSSDPVSRKRVLELQINQARAQGKTDKHPDIVIGLAELAQLNELLADQIESDAPLSPAESALRNELRVNEVRARVLRNDMARLAHEIQDTEDKIAATAGTTAIVSQMNTELDGLAEQIRVLQEKKISADLGRSVESVQKGVRFVMVESAAVPESPSSPNRLLWLVVGTALSAALGFAVAAVRELSDQSFHSVTDLQDSLNLPVLGTISNIELPGERAQNGARRRKTIFTGVIVLGVLAGGSALAYLAKNVAERIDWPSEKTAISDGVKKSQSDPGRDSGV